MKEKHIYWFNIIIWILSILVLSRICISTKDSNISDIGSQIVLLVRSFPLHFSQLQCIIQFSMMKRQLWKHYLYIKHLFPPCILHCCYSQLGAVCGTIPPGKYVLACTSMQANLRLSCNAGLRSWSTTIFKLGLPGETDARSRFEV